MARILYIAYPLLTVSGESAGGAEQVLWTLERAMARRGLDTTVAASSGSRVAGALFSTGVPCIRPDDYERRRAEHEDAVVDFVRRRAREGRPFDLIHDMSGSFWLRAAEVDLPVLATLHLPRSFYPPGSFSDLPANVAFNCVSHLQARTFTDLRGLLAVAPNGIELDLFQLDYDRPDRFEPENHSGKNGKPGGRRGLLWLGRICEEKGPHLALEIAARAQCPITIAGQVYPFSYHQQYFEREVAPRLRQMPDATYIPAPTAELKRRLLRRAQAVLITSLAEETSSLVAMEAAASGTPVIAFRRGALPEVVRDGLTGFLVEGVEGAVEALSRLSTVHPTACMQHAGKNFGSAGMAGRYAQLYERLAATSRQKNPARNPSSPDLPKREVSPG
jgi:glycosyltransferase involved in cell wall biosynthesis